MSSDPTLFWVLAIRGLVWPLLAQVRQGPPIQALGISALIGASMGAGGWFTMRDRVADPGQAVWVFGAIGLGMAVTARLDGFLVGLKQKREIRLGRAPDAKPPLPLFRMRTLVWILALGGVVSVVMWIRMFQTGHLDVFGIPLGLYGGPMIVYWGLLILLMPYALWRRYR